MAIRMTSCYVHRIRVECFKMTGITVVEIMKLFWIYVITVHTITCNLALHDNMIVMTKWYFTQIADSKFGLTTL